MKKILFLLLLTPVVFGQATKTNPNLPATNGNSGKILRVNGVNAEWVSPTKAMIGLQNVPNVDATNPVNIAQSSAYRFASDAEKSNWNANKIANNVSALKTMQGSSIDKVNLLGYYTKGDGGGQEMYWDATSTATPDDGTIIQATGVTTGRWLSVKTGTYNIKQFGAIADGTTDNTAIFQKALNAGNVYLPTGTYKINGTISIPSNRVLEAETGTVLLGNMTAEGMGGYPNTMFVNADTTAGNANITFNNIKFDFNKRAINYDTGTSVNSLKFTKVTNLYFNNCEFFDFVTNYDASLVGTKNQLKFGMAFFDRCTSVSLRNIKTSKIREEGFNFYECSSVSIENWIADGTVVNTSSHAGLWYCEGVSIKNCFFTHTGGSVLNICSSNVVVDNVRVNEGLTQAGRGLDFGNELHAKPFNANNISLSNSYVNVKEYGVQNPSDTAIKMAVKNFIIRNNTFVVGVANTKCAGIFLRGALSSTIEGNRIEMESVSTAGIGRCIVVVPYNNQVIASTVRNNTLFGNCGIELYCAFNSRVNNLEVGGNTFTAQGIGAMSSLTGNSAFFYFRTTSAHIYPYYLNNLDISGNTAYNVEGSFILMNLDVTNILHLKGVSVTRNYFYGPVGSNSQRGIQLGGTGISGSPFVTINNNFISNSNAVVLLGLNALRMHNNTFKYETALADHRVKLYAHNGSVLFHNNTFDNVSTSGSYSDLKQMSASTYTVVQNSSNFSYRTDNSIGFTTDLPANSANVVGKLNVLATGSAASSGTATLVNGTVTIPTTAVTASSKIFVSRNTKGGATIGTGFEAPAASITPGTSFVVNSVTSGGAVVTTDVSTVNWWIIN